MKLDWLVPLLAGFELLGAPDLDKAGREVVSDLWARRFEAISARSDETLKKAIPPLKMAQTWDSITAQVGPFEAVRSVQISRQGAYQIVVLTTHFAHGDLDIKTVFDDQLRLAGFFILPAGSAKPQPPWQPPSYSHPSSFTEQELQLNAGTPNALGATLTLPSSVNSKSPFAAVILVAGSGPHDRDETVGPQKPFKDLAWGLASQGIAILRYEKRTKAHPESFVARPSYTVDDEVIQDARAAAQLLFRRPEIDKHRIFIAGHSLGGYLAPRIAQGQSAIAGLIILEGAARPLEDIVVEQITYLAGADSPMAAQASQSRRRIQDPHLKPLDSIDLLGAQVPGSYFLDLRRYHPAELAAGLKTPVLVIQCERDYQVTMADFALWKKSLEPSPHQHGQHGQRSLATFKTFAGLNHLLMTGTGKPGPDEYDIPAHVDEQIIHTIATWVSSIP